MLACSVIAHIPACCVIGHMPACCRYRALYSGARSVIEHIPAAPL